MGGEGQVSPGSPLGCFWPCWCTSQQHSPGLQDQSKPIWRRVSCVIWVWGSEPGDREVGHAWFPFSPFPPPRPVHPLPSGHIMSPGATPTSPPKLRGLCPIVQEPLVKPGVGVGRPGSVGEDLAAPGILGLISLVPISAQTVLLVFPVTTHITPRKASSPHSPP